MFNICLQTTGGWEAPWSNHQQPVVNYLPCFENDDVPCRLHVFHVVCRVHHRSRNRVNSSLQVAGPRTPPKEYWSVRRLSQEGDGPYREHIQYREIRLVTTLLQMAEEWEAPWPKDVCHGRNILCKYVRYIFADDGGVGSALAQGCPQGVLVRRAGPSPSPTVGS